MKKQKSFFLLFLLILFVQKQLLSVEKGSSTAVSVEGVANFPALDSDNKMCAFGWFKNGFTLEDSTTSCTFESLFPISGDIYLNGGILYLASDLLFANVTNLKTLGTIDGDAHVLEFDSSVTWLCDKSRQTVFKDVDIFFNSDFTIASTIKIEGDCLVDGSGGRMSLDGDANVIVGHNSTLRIKDINVEGLYGYKVRCLDETAKIILDNVKLYFDDNYTFSVGSLEIFNKVDLRGDVVFYYDSIISSTVNSNSMLTFSDGITLEFYPSDSSRIRMPFIFMDTSSKIKISNATWQQGPGGIQVTKGTVIFDGRVDVNSNSTNTSEGLILGDGTEEGDVIVQCNSAADIHFNAGHVTYDITVPDGFKSMSDSSKFFRPTGSCFYAKQDVTFSNVSIQIDYDAPVIMGDGKNLVYDGCKVRIPGVKFSATASRYSSITNLLSGDNQIFIHEGIFPMASLVLNSGNSITGNGSITGPIILQGGNAELTINLDGQILSDIILYGSKVILGGDLDFGQDHFFQGAGTVNLGSYNLILGTKDLNWTSTIYWDGNYGLLEMNSDAHLSGAWTVSGNCILEGENHTLQLGSTGRIYVERGSTLELRRVRLKDVWGNEISCLDDAGKIVFSDVRFTQSGDFNFSTGCFDVEDVLDIRGGYIFSYQSNKQSTIKSGATLKLREDVIFSYNPNSVLKNLIAMEDSDSCIQMDCATLHSTQTGLQLTKGILKILGENYISSDATCKAEGIIFGDGSSADNDVKLDVLSDSCLELIGGYLVYKNLS